MVVLNHKTLICLVITEKTNNSREVGTQLNRAFQAAQGPLFSL